MKHASILAALGLSMLVVSACGGRSLAGDSEPQAETEGGHQTGDVGHDDPDDPDRPRPEISCEGHPVDHAEECGRECPIVEDVRVMCDGSGFGDPGLRVAPGPDATWLVTASNESAWLMALDRDGLMAADELPPELHRETISLALDPEGAPHLAADGTEASGGEYPGGLVFVSVLADGYEVETIFDAPNKYVPLFDMEYDAQGRAHLWFSSDPPNGRSEAIREPDGSWNQHDAPVPGTSGWQRFTVTPGGASVAFDFVDQGGFWYLAALADDVTQHIGSAFGSSYPGAYVHVTPPALPATEASGPDYVVVKEHADGFRIAWPSDDGPREIVLEETAPLESTCVVDWYDERGCPESCEEAGSGVEDRMAAVARTTDGRVWAAWMVTYLDQTRSYQESCSEEGGCWCNSTIERENSRGELVLAEVDLETREVREVLRSSDTNPALHGLFVDHRSSPRPLDMRAFGSDLAIGARVRDTDAFSPPAIRVLRVDTTQIQ